MGVWLETVGDSAFNEDYIWDDGTLIIDLDINSQLNSESIFWNLD